MIKAQIKNKIKDKILDYESYAAKFLKIRDKNGDIVKFNRNKAQKKLYRAIQESIQNNKPPRIIILKARQIGFSTETEAEIFHRTSTQFNRKAMIIAHIREASDNLFKIFKTFYNELPSQLQPQLNKSNEKKLEFGKLNSEIKIATAESREKLGRSDTIQDLHASEVAFWSDADAGMLALLQVVPERTNTLVVAESTANGIGGWFYDTYIAAKNNENDWTPLFFPWFENDEYRKEFENVEERENFIDLMNDYEKNLITHFKLELEQVNWYRYTLRNKVKNDKDKMFQEYPTTEREAFLATGRPVFDVDICFRNFERSVEGVKGNLILKDEKVIFVENKNGFIELHKEIKIDEKEHNVFAAGTDVAEGLEQGDRSIIKVLDRRDNKVCLTWSGHIDADLLGDEQKKIQIFLKNKVQFATEKNNHGLTTITRAFDLGVNQYYREDFSKGYEVGKKEIGWITNSKTKPYMINLLEEWIRKQLFTDTEKEFWSECLTFVKDSHGKMGAQGKLANPGVKCYDDRVIAGALMIVCSIWMPNYFREEYREPARLPEYLNDYELNTYELTETSL